MINYLKGDATNPLMSGNKIIIHICNCNNGFGKGFVLSLKNRYPSTEVAYRSLFINQPKNKWQDYLGLVQFVKVKNDLVVGNMIAQKGYRTINNPIPLQYDALEMCLKDVAKYAIEHNAVVVGPRFGSSLAGGGWNRVETMITNILCKQNISVYVYDL